MVEFDVQLSKDKIPVIYHDFELATTSLGKNGENKELIPTQFNSLTLAQLRGLKVFTFRNFIFLTSAIKHSWISAASSSFRNLKWRQRIYRSRRWSWTFSDTWRSIDENWRDVRIQHWGQVGHEAQGWHEWMPSSFWNQLIFGRHSKKSSWFCGKT